VTETRRVQSVIEPQSVLEGAGVRLQRSIGTRAVNYLDPFLLLDDFSSRDRRDYEAGFPQHPHRGIETVTYILQGAGHHKDTLGNAGSIGTGDIQWMTSGRGILHEEMPQVRPEGIAGFQIWVNLPAKVKMTAPRYQDVRSDRMPEIEGRDGDEIHVKTGAEPARFLLVSGKPLGEPIARYGPFVITPALKSKKPSKTSAAGRSSRRAPGPTAWTIGPRFTILRASSFEPAAAGGREQMRSARARRFAVGAALAAGILVLGAGEVRAQAGAMPAGTPPAIVATYESLADAILAVKRTEANLVRAILGTGYAHAQVELDRARKAIKAVDAKGSQAALEGLAAAVGQLGTEGDMAVGAVRKRLLEGGHHHNAAGEAKGIYDEGFVVVTRSAKQAFLDASKAIGQLARAPKGDALETEWRKVEVTWASLM
jgi:hypothetical protein